MSVRYLEADRVSLPSRSPLFVQQGHCQWCDSELTGRQRLYCSEECTWAFYGYWTGRPAYVRATFIRDNFTCQECGYHRMLPDRPWLPDMSFLECDHIIPVSRGGPTILSNLQTLCRDCNRRKGNSLPGDEPLTDGVKLRRVAPSRDKSPCPDCGSHGYRQLDWEPPPYFDPLMVKVECTACGGISFIAPNGS